MSRGIRGRLRRGWQRFWDAAPRRIRITRDGRVIMALAFGVGFAAVNTGNNLLFLGWGLLLSGIVVSGLLSEGTLRVLRLRLVPEGELRVGEPAAIPARLANGGRSAAYGVEIEAAFAAPAEEVVAAGPYILVLRPAEDETRYLRFVPASRGRHRLRFAAARTAYPFGFFEKDRRFEPDSPLDFWVAPERLPVGELVAELEARLGDEGAARVGLGDEFFTLRPQREGDDPRRVHWRRSAKIGRNVVIENEARAARELELVLAPMSAADPDAEYRIALCGSLAEALLGRGHRVGLLAPGTRITADGGARQRQKILMALARVEPSAALPPTGALRNRVDVGALA